MAEDAAMHHHDADVTQPAYLATQNARLAQAHAAQKADEARIAAGQTERDQIQLQRARARRRTRKRPRRIAKVRCGGRDQSARSGQRRDRPHTVGTRRVEGNADIARFGG